MPERFKLATLLTMLVVLFGSTVSAQTNRELVIATQLEPPTLDLQTSVWRSTLIIAHQIYDFLLTALPGGEYVSGVASDWSRSDDGLTWTFTLRDGVTFHDGTRLDADAVKFNFERIKSLGAAAGGLASLAAAVDNVQVLDPLHVQVHLASPYAPFLNEVGGIQFGLVSPAAVAKYGDAFAQNPVGSGPYRFVEWVPNSHVTLERFEGYAWPPGNFEPQEPYFERVTYRIIPESSAFVASLQRGEAQILDFVAPLDVLQIGSPDNTITQLTPGLPAGYQFNTVNAPTNDIAVRRAVAHAIDRSALLQAPAFGRGLVPAEYTYLSQTNWAHNPEAFDLYGYAYDPGEAKRILEEAGWTAGRDGIREKDGRRLELRVLAWPAIPMYAATDVIVEQMLREVGIALDIQALDQASLVAAVGRGEFNLVLFSGTGFDPDSPLSRNFSSAGGANWSRISLPDLDSRLRAAASEMDEDARRAKYLDIQSILYENLPFLPLFNYAGFIVKSPSIDGVWSDPRTGFRIYGAYLRD